MPPDLDRLQDVTTLRDLILLELDRRGAVPGGVALTMARTHVRSLSVEELTALRDRLGEELVDPQR